MQLKFIVMVCPLFVARIVHFTAILAPVWWDTSEIITLLDYYPVVYAIGTLLLLGVGIRNWLKTDGDAKRFNMIMAFAQTIPLTGILLRILSLDFWIADWLILVPMIVAIIALYRSLDTVSVKDIWDSLFRLKGGDHGITASAGMALLGIAYLQLGSMFGNILLIFAPAWMAWASYRAVRDGKESARGFMWVNTMLSPTGIAILLASLRV